MLTAKPVPLTSEERKVLREAASYHGRLARLRLERFIALLARVSLLVLGIAAVLVPVLWFIEGPARLAGPLVAFSLGALVMVVGIAAIAQTGVRSEHEGLVHEQ